MTMLQDKDRIFTNLYGMHDRTLAGAKARGHWDGTKDLIGLGRDKIVEIMKASGPARARRRGLSHRPQVVLHAEGIGRAALLPRGQCRRIRARHLQGPGDHAQRSPHADRGVPDRLLRDGAHACYIYIRGEYIREREALQAAIDEAYDAGLLGKNAAGSGWDFDLYLHHGAGAYICGEETALLESLEGKKGMPRMKPPFPAGAGLYGCPTTVNNVESIAVVPTILRRGAEWFAGFGRPNNAGTKLFAISGHVNNPCVVEEAMSIPFDELIERIAAASGAAGTTSRR
jgi:NADH-quinone oxidoreductase subunit F